MSPGPDCDGSCSSMQPAPGTKFTSHEEIEHSLDIMLSSHAEKNSLKNKIGYYSSRTNLEMEYRLKMKDLEEDKPGLYNLLRKIGFPKPYKSPYES